MKKLWMSLALAASLLATVAITGCSSTPPSESKAARMKAVAELATFTGSQVDLIDNPDHRPFYVASLTALDSLLQSKDYDPAKFVAALRNLPIKRIGDDKGAIIVTSAVILWDLYAAEVVNLDKAVYVKPVIEGVRSGLARALGQ